MYEQVPTELKELKQWCMFKLVQRNGRNTKVPVNAETGELAKSNDESTWSDFQTAVNGVREFGADGIGFFFKPPYIGIDLDDVREDIERFVEGDTQDNRVAEFIGVMESYAEISPSGTGLHIIAKGEIPEGGNRKGGVEMYGNGRFFTVTGYAIGGYQKINEDRSGRVKFLHEKYIGAQEIRSSNLDDQYGNDLSQEEIIQAARKSRTGPRFSAFMDGGWELFYPSQSEAEMAFANDLAFWTNRNFSMMDSIFRESSLMRDKWDAKRGASTYGEQTLNKAIESCENVFLPKRSDDDFNIYVLDQETKKIEKKFFSYDDTGNAERFIHKWGDFVRYNFVRKVWYIYDGKRWIPDNMGRIKKMVDQALDDMKKEPIFVSDEMDEEEAQKALRRHVKYSRGSNGKTNMLKESQHLVSVDMDNFDNDPHLFNVSNGYIDLESASLRDHERERYFTKQSPVEFTDTIDCPRWLEFLDETFKGNKELISYIKRSVGYSLSGSTEEQKMFILYGHGRNGKSVFLDIISEILGDYRMNIQPQSLMVKNASGGANSDIARLKGARLVTTTEPDDGMRFDEGLVKQITGGDTITARFLYGEEFDYEPEFKVWMATNHKPIIRGTDEGIWRRLAIIPFTNQVPEEKADRQLTNKLRAEIRGILNWAVEGYQEWREIGLQDPQIVKEQRDEYRKEMDPLEEFVIDRCVVSPKAEEFFKDLYIEYKEWSESNGYYTYNKTKFGVELSKKYEKGMRKNARTYRGLSLVSESSNSFFKLNY